MGTQGLLKLVSPLLIYVNLTMWVGRRVGIDASMVIHQLLTRFALAIVKGDWAGFLKAVVDRIMSLRRAGCVPLVVFDGRRVSAKVANASRAERRARSLEKLNQQCEAVRCLQGMLKSLSGDLEDAVQADDNARAEDILKRNVEGAADVQAHLKKAQSAAGQGVGAFAIEAAERVQEACRARGIPFQVALYESETHLVALQLANEVDAIIGLDSDFITIGAENVMRLTPRGPSEVAKSTPRGLSSAPNPTACSLLLWRDSELASFAFPATSSRMTTPPLLVWEFAPSSVPGNSSALERRSNLLRDASGRLPAVV